MNNLDFAVCPLGTYHCSLLKRFFEVNILASKDIALSHAHQLTVMPQNVLAAEDVLVS